MLKYKKREGQGVDQFTGRNGERGNGGRIKRESNRRIGETGRGERAMATERISVSPILRFTVSK